MHQSAASAFCTRERLRRFAVCAALAASVFASVLLLSRASGGGLDFFGNPLFADFAQIHLASQIVADGKTGELYQQKEFFLTTNRLLENTGYYSLYPPVTGYLFLPFSPLHYQWAAWIFFFLNLLLAWWLCRDITGHLIPDKNDAALAAWMFWGSFPVWRTLLFGQNSFLSLAFVWCFYRCRERYPLAGGLALSLGLFKPQLFIGLWLWAMLFGSMKVRGGLLLGLTAGWAVPSFFGGGGIWIEWVKSVTALTPTMKDDLHLMHSLHHAWLLLFGSCMFPVVEKIIFVFAAIFFLAVLLRMRLDMRRDEPASMGWALLGTIVLSPRIFQYDLVLLCPLLAGLWARKAYFVHARFWVVSAYFCFWLHEVAGRVHLPVPTVLGIAGFCYWGQRILREKKQE